MNVSTLTSATMVASVLSALCVTMATTARCPSPGPGSASAVSVGSPGAGAVSDTGMAGGMDGMDADTVATATTVAMVTTAVMGGTASAGAWDPMPTTPVAARGCRPGPAPFWT